MSALTENGASPRTSAAAVEDRLPRLSTLPDIKIYSHSTLFYGGLLGSLVIFWSASAILTGVRSSSTNSGKNGFTPVQEPVSVTSRSFCSS